MKDNLRLDGKVAAITGADSGIGREIALLFAKHGAKVALLSNHKVRLEQMTAEIQQNGGTAQAFCANVMSEEQVQAVFTGMEEAFGQVDILINCAGVFEAGKISEITYAQWQAILDVNLNGVFLCSKYAVAAMLRTGGGSIVNISSEAGIAAIAGQVAYNVSKSAVLALTKSMAVDYALDNIRVNCVCPGRVLTPMVQQIVDSAENPTAMLRELSCDRPVMHIGNPLDIAYACLHFSDESMPYATGAILSVDGGYTAR